MRLVVVVGVVRIHSPSIRHGQQKNCCNQNYDVKFHLDFNFDPTATSFCKPKEQSKPVIIRIHHTVGSDLLNALEIGEAYKRNVYAKRNDSARILQFVVLL